MIFQRPTGFLKDLLIEAGDGSAELILVKFELRPETFASLASRFLTSGFSRMLRVALLVFAMNT